MKMAHSSFTSVQSALCTRCVGHVHGRAIARRRHLEQTAADEGVYSTAQTTIDVENTIELVRTRLACGCPVALEEWRVDATS